MSYCMWVVNEKMGTLETYPNRPSVWATPSDETPLKVKGGNKFPAKSDRSHLSTMAWTLTWQGK